MSLREEFVMLASQPRANRRQLCRRFGISPKTGYKWLNRYAAGHAGDWSDRSRRPSHSPGRTSSDVESQVVALRHEHPAWGGRKLARRLRDLGHVDGPAPATVTAILRRHGLIDPDASAASTPHQRFEHPRPNAFWQMDFKGHFPLSRGRCHPLTVLDDHARYNLALAACGDEQGATVQTQLTATFRRYGLPEAMGMDNGAPWGHQAAHTLTPLTVWLLRLGIRVGHSRPYHPQTLGKDERFHRTLKAEVLRAPGFADLAAAQQGFDRWRAVYNGQRPHEALAMAVPASRYQPSARALPETLPPIEYAPGRIVRKVQAGGEIVYHGQPYSVPKALRGYPVALQPTESDGQWTVYFCDHAVAQIDLRHRET